MITIDDRRFAVLFHAYGRATDLPERLHAVAEGDDGAAMAALGYLKDMVLHQDTAYPATGPVALVLAQILGSEALAGPARARVRAELLSVLSAVGWAVSDSQSLDPFRSAMARMADRDFDTEFAHEVARVARTHYGGDEEAALEEVLEEEQWAEGSYARALSGCLRAAPTLLDGVRAHLTDPDPRVRRIAEQAQMNLLAAIHVGSAGEL